MTSTDGSLHGRSRSTFFLINLELTTSELATVNAKNSTNHIPLLPKLKKIKAIINKYNGIQNKGALIHGRKASKKSDESPVLMASNNFKSHMGKFIC
jgi:hypothetical protein